MFPTLRPAIGLLLAVACLIGGLLLLAVFAHRVAQLHDVEVRHAERTGYVLAAFGTVSDTPTAPLCTDDDPCTVTLSPAGWQAVSAVSAGVLIVGTASMWLGLRR